jgi:hypothetical protein
METKSYHNSSYICPFGTLDQHPRNGQPDDPPKCIILAWYGWMGEQMTELIWLALYIDKTTIKTIIKINVKGLSSSDPTQSVLLSVGA